GEPLAFPAGKAVTTLTHHRVETVGQRRDKVSSPCPTQRLPQLLLTRLRPSQQQVSADGVVEQVPVLGHHAHGGTQGRKRQVPHIDPGQPDRALVHVVEPSQQVRNRRFSRPEDPTRATSCPGSTRNDTPCSTSAPPRASSCATSSKEPAKPRPGPDRQTVPGQTPRTPAPPAPFGQPHALE